MDKKSDWAIKKSKIYDRLFDFVIYFILIVIMIITIYPFLNVVAISFNDSLDTIRGGVHIWPREFTLENYKEIFKYNNLVTGFINSTLRTVIGTILGVISAAMLEKFMKNRTKEIERGTSLAGPHRDDLIFRVNGMDVQTYGSQGQQRTTALSLKLAEIELIYNEIGEYPILLLDDVLSELDDFRQSHLLNTIQGKVQTFVTTTSVDGIHHETLDKAELFQVTNGNVALESR